MLSILYLTSSLSSALFNSCHFKSLKSSISMRSFSLRPSAKAELEPSHFQSSTLYGVTAASTQEHSSTSLNSFTSLHSFFTTVILYNWFFTTHWVGEVPWQLSLSLFSTCPSFSHTISLPTSGIRRSAGRPGLSGESEKMWESRNKKHQKTRNFKKIQKLHHHITTSKEVWASAFCS